MSAVSAAPLSPPPPAPAHADGLAELAESCLDQTAEALLNTRAASQVEVSHAVDMVRRAAEERLPLDLIEAVARTQGHQEEHLGTAVMTLAGKVAGLLNPAPQLIPFAGKLIAPSAFYESFDHLHQAARALLAPIIFAEDTDAIGVAALNPIAGSILASAIQESVVRRVGIRPFLTVVRLDYESWTFLCRKHFEL